MPGLSGLLNKKRFAAPVREPHRGESDYFRGNPSVAGMATEDGAVTLNPFINLTGENRQSVIDNETARVFMRGFKPSFALTDEQRSAFAAYSKDEQDVRDTIAARIFSGDPSAGTPTPEQLKFVEELRKAMGR